MRLSKGWYVGVYATWIPAGIVSAILTAIIQQNQGSQSVFFVIPERGQHNFWDDRRRVFLGWGRPLGVAVL